jgi:hypothetical protein
MSGRIEPRTLKGFRDYLPEMMIPRERLLEAARGVYRRYGFAPIDTPALEYAEILLGKGGEESDKIVYRFQDHGNRDVALRFDLTVPFARFAAMHVGKLGIPFKRYAMGPVWRGENTGHGRYREFWQCDFDTIGTTSVSSDAEALLVAHDLMVAAGIERFVLRVNHRQVLGGLLDASQKALEAAAKGGLGAFLYLEVLDASFSFDGVIGAFALSQNLFIIAIGLGIGAMYVRSMTIMLVEKGTLAQYRYLEHGAFYAILILSVIMYAQAIVHIPEVLTGLGGAALIGFSLWSSIRWNRANG